MPRLSHSLPKYRKHRSSGQAVVTLSGQDYYLGPHGTKVSKQEYDRLVGEWLAVGRNPLHVGQEELTITELAARYWKFAKRRYRKNGRCTRVTPNIKCALRYVKTSYGKHLAVEFGPLALKAIRQRMVEDDLSRRYINDHVDRIRRMFKWAVGEQLIPASTYEALRSVEGLRRGQSEARETEPVLPVDDAVVDATLPHLPDVVADMVRLQRYTGMRPAELCLMRPCDVDRTGDVWTYRPESHKTEHHGRERVVFIGPKGQGVLLRYLVRDSQTYCFRPCDSEEKRRADVSAVRTTPLKYGNRRGTNQKRKPKRKAGEKYSTDSYRRAIHRACVKANIEKWSPNRLRHATATQVRREFGLEHAQVLLGHAAADVTQIYAQRDLTKGIEVASQIG